MRKRVKITGIGPVTPAGIGRAEFHTGINRSTSRVRTITRFDPSAGVFIGAEIPGFDLESYLPEENPRRHSRHTQFGMVAGKLAMIDSGLTARELRSLDPVIVTGTSIMDLDKIGKGIETVIRKGPRHAPSTIIYEASVVNVAAKIAQQLEVPCRMLTLQTSCCSGLDAIGHAAELIASGQADIAIAGGAESPFAYYPMLAFNACELSPTAPEYPEKSCRPFDLWRSTGVLGEGAAMLVLETEESKRPPIAWISGYGYANDNDGCSGSGLYEAGVNALANARLRASDVDLINAWGPGHRMIDCHEAAALCRLFGDRLAEIPATSIKGAIGTALGASGAIQTASAVLSLSQGTVPPTVNWLTPDPSCPLNLSSQARRLNPNVAIVNSHGLSGSNSVLVIQKTCPG